MTAPSEFEIPDDDFERMMDFLKDGSHTFLRQDEPRLLSASRAAKDYCMRNEHQDLDGSDLINTHNDEQSNVVQISMFLVKEPDPVYAFRLRWGTKDGRDSPWVALAKLHQINDKDEMQWMYYQPKNFSDKEGRAIAVGKACKTDTFVLDTTSVLGDNDLYWEWQKEENVAVWEISPEEEAIFPREQFYHCKNVMKGVAIAKGVEAQAEALKARMARVQNRGQARGRWLT